MDIKLYNQQGKEVGQAQLPEGVFGLPINADLLHQAVVAQRANARQVLAHTKDRSEVRGGGRKPWRQKGTGRARHGSRRSPIWIGGGITFGPSKERVFAKKMNKKMKRKALFVSLSSKIHDEEMVVLDKLSLTEGKTKELLKCLQDLSKATKKELLKGSLIVVPQVEADLVKAVNNISKVRLIRADSLNILDVLNYKNMILTQEAIGLIEDTFKV